MNTCIDEKRSATTYIYTSSRVSKLVLRGRISVRFVVEKKIQTSARARSVEKHFYDILYVARTRYYATVLLTHTHMRVLSENLHRLQETISARACIYEKKVKTMIVCAFMYKAERRISKFVCVYIYTKKRSARVYTRF